MSALRCTCVVTALERQQNPTCPRHVPISAASNSCVVGGCDGTASPPFIRCTACILAGRLPSDSPEGAWAYMRLEAAAASGGNLRLSVQLPVEVVSRLLALSDVDTGRGLDAQLQPVLEQLAATVAAGVRRPGSWERAWVVQAFGDQWAVGETQPDIDPDAPIPYRPTSTGGDA